MSAQARVGRIHPDDTVRLELLEPPRCGGCEGWCVWRWRRAAPVRLRSSLALEPEDLVTISIDRRHLLRGALILHGLPWAGLLAGALLGAWGVGGDPGALFGALMGLGVGALVARRGHSLRPISPVITRADES